MKKIYIYAITMLLAVSLTACRSASDNIAVDVEPVSESQYTDNIVDKADEIEYRINLEYAKELTIDYLEDGLIRLMVNDGNEYIVIPKSLGEMDAELKEAYSDSTIIHQGSENIYLAATSAMDLVTKIDGLDNIRFCSTKPDDYAIEEAKERIESGETTYIGKYSAPDFEALLAGNCDLAIESTMIYHSPDIREEIEALGIPVFVERSSYETDPLGRLEWIKLYGVLFGKEKEASEFFDEQVAKVRAVVEKLDTKGSSHKKVAIFYISSNGYVNVRKNGDYLTKMIELAGGSYALENILPEEENALSTMNISWEDFYKEAHDSDILIYNGTIDGGIASISDLLAKNGIFSDFKAVSSDNVYCTGMNMFQESSAIAEVIVDLYRVINNVDDKELKYLYKVN